MRRSAIALAGTNNIIVRRIDGRLESQELKWRLRTRKCSVGRPGKQTTSKVAQSRRQASRNWSLAIISRSI